MSLETSNFKESGLSDHILDVKDKMITRPLGKALLYKDFSLPYQTPH